MHEDSMQNADCAPGQGQATSLGCGRWEGNEF